MDAELTCPTCDCYFTKPVLLMCGHSMCTACIRHNPATVPSQGDVEKPLSCSELSTSEQHDNGRCQKSDGSIIARLYESSLSLVSPSEISFNSTDSGLSSNTSHAVGIGWEDSNVGRVRVKCAVCGQCTLIEDARRPPINHLLEKLVTLNSVGHKNSSQSLEMDQTHHGCDLCESSLDAGCGAELAVVYCFQCSVKYCEQCLLSFHPKRGPLANHMLKRLMTPTSGSETPFPDSSLQANVREGTRTVKASQNRDSPHCGCCSGTPISRQEVKQNKSDLSKCLHSLTTKVKQATDWVSSSRMHLQSQEISAQTLKSKIETGMDALINVMMEKKWQMLSTIDRELELLLRPAKQAVEDEASRVVRSTHLLKLCLEALKENDGNHFMQVKAGLKHRVIDALDARQTLLELDSRFEMNFDSKPLHHAIETSCQLTRIARPKTPKFCADKCRFDDNSVTLTWDSCKALTSVYGYILEMRAGDCDEKEFKAIYEGKDNACVVDGLQDNTIYNVRVKAFNRTGQSNFSSLLPVHTSKTVMLTFCEYLCHPSVFIHNANNSAAITCQNNISDTFCVAIVTSGFSRGVHYWEYVINRWENSDVSPRFGVARFDCPRDQMLGANGESWALYGDRDHCWFMHDSSNIERFENVTMSTDSIIGILLDMDCGTLSVYIDYEPLTGTGIVARNLTGLLHPAVSISGNLRISIANDIKR